MIHFSHTPPLRFALAVLVMLAVTISCTADQISIGDLPKTIATGDALDVPVTYTAEANSKATQLIIIFQQPKHSVKKTVYRKATRGNEQTTTIPIEVPGSAADGPAELFAYLSGPGWAPTKQAKAYLTVKRGANAIDADTVKLTKVPSGVWAQGQKYNVTVNYTLQEKSPANHLVLVFEQGAHKVKKTWYARELKRGAKTDYKWTVTVPSTAQEGRARLYVAMNGKGWSPTVETTAHVDIGKATPIVDRYGQYALNDWPGKIKTDDDLKRVDEEEVRRLAQWPRSKDFDKYGGWLKAGWTAKATGFYRVEKRDGYWWLISPEGNPCFYTGLSAVPGLNWPMTPIKERRWMFEELPSREGAYGAAWSHRVWGWGDDSPYVAFHTVNQIRKWGENGWKKIALDRAEQRLFAWGFSGGGKWGGLFGDGARLAKSEGIGCFGYVHTHGKEVPKIGGKPDVWNPEVRKAIHDTLERQTRRHRDNPFVVGWGVNNETDWVKAKHVLGFLKQDADCPGKVALVDFALKRYDGNVAALAEAWKIDAATKDDLYGMTLKPTKRDLEALRHYFSDEYLGFIYQTMKKVTPNHLYFGYWIVPFWWDNKSDWHLIAKHCDVLGYDHYAQFHDAGIEYLMRDTDMPILLGEFSFTPHHNGTRGYKQYKKVGAVDDADAGRQYAALIKRAAEDPRCIGALWFHYRDQPLTGRGPGQGNRRTIGEHHMMGMVDMTDSPKWDMIEQVRKANLAASATRQQAARNKN